MILYTKNNNAKKVYIDEARMRLLREHFDENREEEGGIYNINNIRRGREKGAPTYLDSDYSYTHDNGNDGVYADFTPYGKKKGYLNPLNKNWIQVRNNMPYQAKKSQRYPQISDEDMPNYMPKSDDEFIRHNGILYMPTKHRIMQGKGDVIKDKLEPDKVFVGLDRNGEKQFVRCYNLTMLGQGGENARKLATMIAHTYKEKDCGYGNLYKDFSLRNRGNLIQGEWKDRITQLINNTSDLINFNPTYIIYPQSSSNFNDYIAEYMKSIFPNAHLLPKDLLQKLDMWEFNYDDLIYQTIDWAENGDNATKYKKVYSKYNVLRNDFIKEALLRRLTSILSTKMARKLYSLYNGEVDNKSVFMERFNSLYRKYYRRNMSRDEEIRASILDKLWNFIYDDLLNIERSLTTSGLFSSVRDLNNYQEQIFVLSLQALFKREDVGRFNGNYIGRNAKDRTENFKNIGAIELSFIRGDIVMNMDGIKQLAQSNDTIKNYDNPSRLALKGQFAFNDRYDLSTINANDRFIVIDDNYASGASIRNAAKVIAELGVPLSNIIGLTPGDMGGASSGGERGANVPENSAEEWLAYNHVVNHAYDNENIPDDVKQILADKHNQLFSNQGHEMQNRTRGHQQNNLGQKFVDYTQKRPYYGGGKKGYSQEKRKETYNTLLNQIKYLRGMIKKYTEDIKQADELEQEEILRQEREHLRKQLKVATTREHNLREKWGMKQNLTKAEDRNKKYYTPENVQNKITELKEKLNGLEKEYDKVKAIWKGINKGYMEKYGRDYVYDKFLNKTDKEFHKKKCDLAYKITQYKYTIKRLNALLKKMQL